MTLPGTRATAAPSTITSIDELHDYLRRGMQLEHATIPVYLTALYSLRPGANSDAQHILRVVAVEEMLHLTLAANVMNAVGGEVSLTGPGFVPAFPARLPDGETDFLIGLEPFSRQALETFLKIERPGKPPGEEQRMVPRSRTHEGAVVTGGEQQAVGPLLATVPGRADMQFYSIGEFYEEIIRGLTKLEAEHNQRGKTLFTGSPGLQVTPEYYYSGGGEVIPVTGLESAVQAMRLVAAQGEGFGGGIYDGAEELAHYYRFQQLKLGRYYLPPDKPDAPTGPPLKVDWDAVYPVQANPKVADYPEGSELRAAAVDFNTAYGAFLGMLTRAYNGEPKLLLDAVWQMFRIRDDMTRLIRNPIPGHPGMHAGPTFEVDGTGKAAS